MNEMYIGLLLPLVGTTLGAGMVFFLKNDMNLQVQRVFTGFAAGVMTAASVCCSARTKALTSRRCPIQSKS